MQRDKEIVHKTMAAIKGKNTSLELAIRKRIHEAGLFYLANSSRVMGHPDLLFPSAYVAVFLDSEFWHGYNYEEAISKVKTNNDFWVKKISRNMARDKEVNEELAKQGYLVLRYWGKQIQDDPDKVASEIIEAVKSRRELLSKSKGITNKTTLAYIEKDGAYLMLYRNKKKNDENQGKWIGIGGHLETNENYIAAMKREIKEETGLNVKDYIYYGAVDFFNNVAPGQRMYLFKVTSFDGELIECNEGELAWIKKEDIDDKMIWEGDKLFMPLLNEEGGKLWRLSVFYDEDGNLSSYIGPLLVKGKVR